jgi:hypothetical protein
VQATEVDALIAVFKDEDRADAFRYLTFARAVDAEDIGSPESRAVGAPPPLSREIEQIVLETNGQIREKLIARHWDIGRAFQGVVRPTITSAEFQQRLASVNLVLVTGQIQALLRKYRVNLSDEVDWKAFVEDVQRSRTVGT